ncbi:ribonuclease domain-containing protein [Streptomyces sp. NE06-03E]|uniref:Ribonuclease n=1 Tax=Streptomyces sp. gb1(2016) TaxID=1828321 RepID=A0A652KXQ0_9ACTN|nr:MULTISPECIES: ribonuclease domain-containing protein [unclassified Streptomyces]WSS72046.1 ribonuclease [Streptomyces sp. NBC_01175]WSS79074.1 ribonuclease [Streptomyces sp. NBC_01174]MDX3057650.1 ribonuclease domain-containing protein [Streptomyces sp. NE06-03E]MDX3323753.1 ribonuclease domain-containing protein [Streptomyces sp. ME02-6979-3A]MDX3428021.1 ribonuclease domain-containing protein [Streptomyces sp. ME01-18a]
MRIPPRITTLGGIAALLSVLFVGGPVTASAATAPRAAAVGSICYSALPSQAHDTLDLIDAGGPFPYEQDGTVFQNREALLPSQSTGYYHEYTVITPGSSDRGARRIVTGEEAEEDYYTADHYESFDLVDHDC